MCITLRRVNQFSTSSSSSSDSSGSNFFCITLFSKNFRSATVDSAALPVYNASIAVIETCYFWGVIVSDSSRVQTIESVTRNQAEEAKNMKVSQTEKQNGIPNGIEFGEAFRFKTITCLLSDFLHCNRSLVVLVLHWVSFIYIYFVSSVLFLSHASYLWTYQ